MGFPYPALNVSGFALRTAMPGPDVAALEALRPGHLDSLLAQWTSFFYSRLRKRYGNSIPLGQAPPVLYPSGTQPPAVFLTGTALVGQFAIAIAITTAGSVGTAAFQWSVDGGKNYVGALAAPVVQAPGYGYTSAPTVFLPPPPPGGTQAAATATIANGSVTAVTLTNAGSGYLGPVQPVLSGGGGTGAAASILGTVAIPVATAAFVGLPGSGLVANFPAGAYGSDNAWAAPPAVPEIFLLWLTQVVTPDAYRARGADIPEPTMAPLEKDRDRILGDGGANKGLLQECADGNNGLLEIPFDDGSGSAQTTGGPYGYSETSPYVAFDEQGCQGRYEDRNRSGSST